MLRPLLPRLPNKTKLSLPLALRARPAWLPSPLPQHSLPSVQQLLLLPLTLPQRDPRGPPQALLPPVLTTQALLVLLAPPLTMLALLAPPPRRYRSAASR